MDIVKAFEKLFDRGLLEAFIENHLDRINLVFEYPENAQKLINLLKSFNININGPNLVKGYPAVINFHKDFTRYCNTRKNVGLPVETTIIPSDLTVMINRYLEKLGKPPRTKKRKPSPEEINNKSLDCAVLTLEGVLKEADIKLLKEELCNTELRKVPYKVIPILSGKLDLLLDKGITKTDVEEDFYNICFDSSGEGLVRLSLLDTPSTLSGFIQIVRGCRKTETPRIKHEPIKLILEVEDVPLKSVNIFKDLPKLVLEEELELLPEKLEDVTPIKKVGNKTEISDKGKGLEDQLFKVLLELEEEEAKLSSGGLPLNKKIVKLRAERDEIKKKINPEFKTFTEVQRNSRKGKLPF